MGMFDILVAYKRCAVCNKVHKHEVQFTNNKNAMVRYQIGDKTEFKSGIYPGLYLEECSATSGRIKEVTIYIHTNGIISIQSPFYTENKFKKGK